MCRFANSQQTRALARVPQPPLKHPQQADPKRHIILVRKETTADDIHGMRSAAVSGEI